MEVIAVDYVCTVVGHGREVDRIGFYLVKGNLKERAPYSKNKKAFKMGVTYNVWVPRVQGECFNFVRTSSFLSDL